MPVWVFKVGRFPNLYRVPHKPYWVFIILSFLVIYMLNYSLSGQCGGGHERLRRRHQRRRPSPGRRRGRPADGQHGGDEGRQADPETDGARGPLQSTLHRRARVRRSRGPMDQRVPAEAVHETKLPADQSAHLSPVVAGLLLLCNCKGCGRHVR